MQSNNKNNQLDENIHHNDLVDLISNVISIDQYKSKLGDDEHVVVVAFEVADADPAQDLSQFLETGHDSLDVDITPGPDDKGKYKVFVELERNSKLFSRVNKLLDDVMRVDNSIDSFMFTSYENKEPQQWSEQAFNNSVITSSYDYVLKHNPKAKEITERIKFLNKY